jgi:hypothetical protein
MNILENYIPQDDYAYNVRIDCVVFHINKILKEKKHNFYLLISSNGGVDKKNSISNNMIYIISNINEDYIYFGIDFKYTRNTNFIEVSNYRDFKYQILFDYDNIKKFTDILIQHITIFDNEISKLSKIFNIFVNNGINIRTPLSNNSKYRISYDDINNKNFILKIYNKNDHREFEFEINNIDNIIRVILKNNPELENTFLNKFIYWLGFIKS